MVILILGSKSDRDWGQKIATHLTQFGLDYEIHVASAHKTPFHLLEIIKKYDCRKIPLVYICIAGRSNALGGFVDASSSNPVINCPPQSDKFAGLDILSSLRMPSGVAPMTVLEPDQAALAAVKILSFGNKEIGKKVMLFQKILREKVINDNKELSK